MTNQTSTGSKRKTGFFCFLCCLIYFTSYLTRIDYAAVLVEIVEDLNVSRELASIAVTGSFITYGVGQLVSGLLGDRVSPRLLIFAGLAATSAVNLSMARLPNIYAMTALWFFNGFFQAMLWPPLVRIMAENLDDRQYTRTCVLVSAAASAATIAVYLLAPVVIHLSGWRHVFVLAGGCGLCVSLLWFAGTRKLNPSVPQKSDAGKQVSFSVLAKAGIVLMMLAIVLQGLLRDGVITWMPAYINDIYSLGTSLSILTTVILPVFSIVSVEIASKLHGKMKNELTESTLLFGIGFAASALMLLVFRESIALSVALMALITGCMHGINLMLISRLPVHFKKYGRVSTISGLLNACTYIGSALSTYGFAALSERYGWYFIIVSWIAVCAAGTAVCALCVRRWARFTEE